jgi:hypothetical protein
VQIEFVNMEAISEDWIAKEKCLEMADSNQQFIRDIDDLAKLYQEFQTLIEKLNLYGEQTFWYDENAQYQERAIEIDIGKEVWLNYKKLKEFYSLLVCIVVFLHFFKII